LVNVFIPPLMSSTMNENILNRVKGAGTPSNDSKSGSDNPQGGRPQKADDQKSEKTIQNRESMN